MKSDPLLDIKSYLFTSIHPQLFIGTMSDRYAGWLGQIYTMDKYQGRITSRVKVLRKNRFQEKILPVESVIEYFQHFPVLEIDFTFYRLLLDEQGEPEQNYHVLQRYARHLNPGNRIFLKVPQQVIAPKIRRNGNYVPNDQYLDKGIFLNRFYSPAVAILGDYLAGFIFEQEYRRKGEGASPETLAAELDGFFSAAPQDKRFHIEIRTGRLWTGPLFEVLKKHQVGLVLSHWTWLPALREQWQRSQGKLLSGDQSQVVRLVTPRGMNYEQTYAAAHPFDAMVPGMLHDSTVEETVEIIRGTVQRGSQLYLFVNNRAGGSAPMIAQRIAREYIESSTSA